MAVAWLLPPPALAPFPGRSSPRTAHDSDVPSPPQSISEMSLSLFHRALSWGPMCSAPQELRQHLGLHHSHLPCSRQSRGAVPCWRGGWWAGAALALPAPTTQPALLPGTHGPGCSVCFFKTIDQHCLKHDSVPILPLLRDR